ncbi:HD domain-containing phosphohydrolase [Clostridium psychrophilum]|uniref:HD domain-containing phosphohydrolase n=1 Tax=Clostridium psychrophilum TaxID=132926 RepID=UPI001C0CC39F|nr:HD domain-containing phosphohydrolase [Clostridium psychrophilum]MBU3182970.1 HD domain-containing protein [Clostridium psychrophilum]
MLELSDILMTKASSIERKIYAKSSLVGISHGLEDMIVEFKLKSEIFVSFQKFKFFMVEFDRYMILDSLCKKVFVFARNIDFDKIKDFKNTVFIELNDDDSMIEEWNIIINHPEHPAVFLSFSADILKETLIVMKNKLSKYGVEYNPSKINYNKEKDIVTRKMRFFINRTLSEIEDKSSQLITKNNLLEKALSENGEITNEIIKRLCYAAEYRDDDSAVHMARMSIYTSILYEQVETSQNKIRLMNYAALMHDIGKIGIPDSILLKAGKLTSEEFNIMKTHTTIGARILKGSKREVIQMGYELALSHHEKWDGSGYPSGLKEKDIPLTARVVAISDVFDALSTARIYKKAFPIETRIEILKSQRNKHFQGELVDLFLENIDRIIMCKKNIDLKFNNHTDEDVFSMLFNNPMSFFIEC